MVIATDVGVAKTRYASPAHDQRGAGLCAAGDFEVHLAVQGVHLDGSTCTMLR